MAKFTFTIPDDKVSEILTSIKGVYPIPMENKGTEEELDMQPTYSDAEWAKQKIKDFVVDTVKTYKRKVAIETAQNSVVREDDLLSYE